MRHCAAWQEQLALPDAAGPASPLLSPGWTLCAGHRNAALADVLSSKTAMAEHIAGCCKVSRYQDAGPAHFSGRHDWRTPASAGGETRSEQTPPRAPASSPQNNRYNTALLRIFIHII
jgi:hypothetical protein